MKKLVVTRKWVLLFSLIGILVLIGGGLFIWNKNSAGNQKLCSEDSIGAELKANFPHFNETQASKMGDITTKITNTKGYDKSITCLYVLGKYNMYQSMPKQASDYFDQVLAIHEKEQIWIDPAVGTDQPETIQQLRDFLKKEIESVNKNNDERAPSLGTKANEP